MLAARQIFLGRGAGGGGWKNPYITDGLIAMFDGEWNAGPRIHDASATTWSDISGNGHDAVFSMGHSGASINPDGQWLSNAYHFPRGSVSTASFSADLGNSLTLQFCVSDRVLDSTYWAFYDTYDDTTNFYHYSGYSQQQVYGQQVYGKTGILFTSGADFLPSTGTVSHFFSITQSGLQVNADAARANNVPIYSSSIKQWCIGGPYATNYFTGKMHCVRIYNRVLKADEFAANYAIDKERFNLP